MHDILELTQKTLSEIKNIIANNVKNRRKELKLSQQELASNSNVSLGSLKRFENKHEISFSSLVKIAIALDCENDLLTKTSAHIKTVYNPYK
jgi:transcriptional regulator with XRE-family HTH domain